MPELRPTIPSTDDRVLDSVESPPSDAAMPSVLKLNYQGVPPAGGTAKPASAHISAQSNVDNIDITHLETGPSVSNGLNDVLSDHPSRLFDHYRFLPISTADAASYDLSQLGDLLAQTHDNELEINHDVEWNLSGIDELLDSAEAVLAEDPGDMDWQIPLLESYAEPSPVSLGDFAASSHLIDNDSTQQIYQQPQSPSGTPEMIRHLFEQQTCAILSIKDDETKNPWRTLVWPLASGCPALYHALAAMTCLHMCKTQSHLRLLGLRHFQSGERALINDENGNMLLEAAIAARLALGFAETWDHQKSSTGIDHINRAKVLIRQAASRHQTSRLTAGNVSRLSFLANTCLYMDVIARSVCMEPQSFNDAEFMTACNSLSSSIPRGEQLDPLMGCAITLFPLIGRLGELVGRVRRRTENRNSLATISKATELRVAIENWVPSIDWESGGGFNSNITDSIQTAEAYRWASLLLLRQAVPELPWAHSIWELASKSLVFLATIPLTSRTTIVHIFPLVIAGCEAFDADDRDWVRERWDLMSKRMITGIVDRCREITMEVWRRRDEYEARHGIVYRKSLQSPASTAAGLARDRSLVSEEGISSRSVIEITTRFDAEARSPSASSESPESAAFKKGIDPVTRAGFIDYTVRGDLHWLTVMKDWNWEVMLG
ncbi:uncharacterized protein A1O5_00278 [Cladophialophora psammophila CBS 110553]|uniref:Transcription factor domain-containing protein n=1 Tax=Cladophialophora psammophila CBS 110553 TaxID=1182543 RepID=W9XFQ2_9EURO|nr:uncharacterized protein A1O5_00278 [Cladophialophora psammophila CBS 110553]EXJ75771.1 hypothetical protein A1O5_00278 [Cladophialophora psammophila CBS 110553]